jgi:hypothetical protein
LTTKIGKKHAGGAPGYYWDEDDSVIEVPDEDARELLRIGTEFYEVVPEDSVEVVKPAPVTSPVSPPAAPPEFPSSTGGIKEAIEVAQVTSPQKKG